MDMRRILTIAYYEIVHIFKDPILLAIVFLAPTAYVALFGAVYHSAILNNIPLAIVDLDHSELSGEIERAFANSPYFSIVEGIDAYEELEYGMKSGSIRAAIVIPQDLQQNAALHRRTQVLTIYDGSNLIWGYNIQKKTLEVIRQFSCENTAAALVGYGLSRTQIADIVNAVDFNITTWYNPNYNYNYFLFMGLVMMVLHQLGLLSVSLSVTREKERNSWIQYLASAIPAQHIILGKCLPYLIVNFFNYTFLLWMAAQFINVKIQGGILLIIILGLLYDIIITFTGFFISLRANNSLQLNRCLMLLSVPVFMISGYTWPWVYMPGLISTMGKMLPFSWMAQGFRMATIKNLNGGEISGVILIMACMAAAAVTATLSFKKTRLPAQETPLAVNAGSAYPRKNK
ncbi:MAG: ABC transporter permease [Syntrophomonadaceae bacterium]